MSDIVTGTPAVVGFTTGRDNYGYQHNHGISDKDQQFAVDIENNERTRDTLAAIYATNVNVEKNGAAAVLATQVASMAGQLATEKIGAAGVLEAAKNAAAISLQAALNASEIRLQTTLQNSEMRLENGRVAAAAALAAAQNFAAAELSACKNTALLAAQIAECCCEQKALTLEVESRRVRDDLTLLQTQFLILSGGVTPAARGRIAA